jgi:pimeloyl-ACP methyl ester carboxylesterase
VDLLGHGRSSPVRHPFSVELQADLIATEVAEPMTVVGHSLGGLIAAALASRWPHRVSQLIVISTSVDIPAARRGLLPRLASLAVVGPALWHISGSRGRRAAARILFAPGFDPPVEQMKSIDQLTHRDLNRSRQMGSRYWRKGRIDAALPNALPVVAVFGAEDRTLHAPSAAAGWRTAGHRVVLLPEIGHSPHIEAPSVIADLILDR